MSPDGDHEPTGWSSTVVPWPKALACHLPCAMPPSAGGEIKECMTASHRSSRHRSCSSDPTAMRNARPRWCSLSIKIVQYIFYLQGMGSTVSETKEKKHRLADSAKPMGK